MFAPSGSFCLLVHPAWDGDVPGPALATPGSGGGAPPPTRGVQPWPRQPQVCPWPPWSPGLPGPRGAPACPARPCPVEGSCPAGLYLWGLSCGDPSCSRQLFCPLTCPGGRGLCSSGSCSVPPPRFAGSVGSGAGADRGPCCVQTDRQTDPSVLRAPGALPGEHGKQMLDWDLLEKPRALASSRASVVRAGAGSCAGLSRARCRECLQGMPAGNACSQPSAGNTCRECLQGMPAHSLVQGMSAGNACRECLLTAWCRECLQGMPAHSLVQGMSAGNACRECLLTAQCRECLQGMPAGNACRECLLTARCREYLQGMPAGNACRECLLTARCRECLQGMPALWHSQMQEQPQVPSHRS
ncbi:uncharacterized protein LOC128797878 isoform X2 [Vidua chalybeata]|uniref:uncharacterized protein LOC128797878 isoform X2 n=1 Tax=Vidua chalybeata TaxID=81927 RepID=UPI0023A90C57|nr:uncharacterized protein LOC128797878 isoform X2 [Vidua chalybeata]